MNDEVKFAWDPKKHERNLGAPPRQVTAKCECGNPRFIMTHEAEVFFYEDRVPNINFGNPIPICAGCGKSSPLETLVENARKRVNFKVIKGPEDQAPA